MFTTQLTPLSFELFGLHKLFACVNLRHKSYHFSTNHFRDEWLKRVNEISGSYEKTEEMKRKFSNFAEISLSLRATILKPTIAPAITFLSQKIVFSVSRFLSLKICGTLFL